MAEIVDKLRESRLRCFGHIMRINIDGKGRRERPKKKWILRIEIDNDKEV